MADINQQQEAGSANAKTSQKKSNVFKRLKEKVATKKANKPPKEKKQKKEKKPRRPFKVVMKTWSKGLGKEASRVTWEKKGEVAKDFITIVVIAVILALIFFAIDLIVISTRR